MVVERRKYKKRKDDGPDRVISTDKPTKEEYAVAKWIRTNVPSKKTKFNRSHTVEYFTGTRVVDALIEISPWKNTLFESREHAVDFLETMLRHKFFHRAKKIVITEDELNRIKGLKKKQKDSTDIRGKTKNLDMEKIPAFTSSCQIVEKKDQLEDSFEEKKNDDHKRKSKVRLEMHMDQYFVDCNDAYVWIYEPIPVYYWFFGALLVLGAIGVCLFPLWPLTVRHGVWYLSIAAAGFLVFILSLVIIRLIVFCCLWIVTIGKHHLWLLPNLVEDVGFFASFWPLYHYEYHGQTAGDIGSYKKNKESKKKNSDCTEPRQQQLKENSKSSLQLSNDCSLAKKILSEENTLKVLDKSSEEDSESEKSNIGDFELI